MSELLKGMDAYIQTKGNRIGTLGYECLRINKSGWIGLSRKLVKKYELDNYKTATFYYNGKNICVRFCKDKSGSQVIRHQYSKNRNIMGYGIFVMGFIKRHQEYVGLWKALREELNEKKGELVILFEKTKKAY